MHPVEVNSNKVLEFLSSLSGLGTGSKNVLVFKTDIDSDDKIEKLSTVLNDHQCLQRWSVDIDDVDNVLRIEGSKHLEEQDIITLLSAKGWFCVPLESC